MTIKGNSQRLPRTLPKGYAVHRSRLRLRIRRSGPPNPPILGGIKVQSPPELTLLANLTIGHIVNSEGFLRPPGPQFWGSKNSKSPRIGGFRGPSAVLTMLQNNSPAASELGDLGG